MSTNGERSEIGNATGDAEMTMTISTSPSSLASDSDIMAAPKSIKKARRQTAFYPNMNSSNKPLKPFSRSAAKRESVMTLGSIEHLQHYFTKTGIAAKQNPLKPNSGAARAIGGPATIHVRGAPSLAGIQESQLPPSPAAPAFVRPPYPQVEKNYEVDPEQLKPGVIKDLQAVSDVWGLSIRDGAELNGFPEKSLAKQSEEFDILTNLKITTRAIRSVRNYLVSLPDESTVPLVEKEAFRARSFTPAPLRRVVSNSGSQSDPLSLIRKSALDVLIVLRALEDSARLPLSDEAYDAQSDHGSSQDNASHTYSRGTSPHPAMQSSMSTHDSESEHGIVYDADTSVAFSVMTVPGRNEGVPVWADEYEHDLFGDEDETVKREVWDERLVLGGGWLYKPDIRLEHLGKEREVIGKYLDTVDDALFGGTRAGVRGWEKAGKDRGRQERDARAKSRRASSVHSDASEAKADLMEEMADGLHGLSFSESRSPSSMGVLAIDEADEDEDVVDDDDLPEWAKRTTFAEDPLARLYALLTHLLPVSLLSLLPSPNPSRSALLDAISSGQLLCIAYNTGVRRSRKPWGYINKDAVHDIAAIEARAHAEEAGGGKGEGEGEAEKRKKGWTFRRTDNLRLWAGALKLRYLLPLVSPSTSTSTSTSNSTYNTHAHTPQHTRSPSKEDTTPTPSPHPAKYKFPNSATAEPPLIFEAKVIARKSEGWEEMLETAVLRWMGRVVDEKRGER